MGLFDQAFGSGVAAGAGQAQDPNNDQQFNQLKDKYQSVLHKVESEQVRLENLHMQDGKLFIKGVAPSEEAMNHVWDQVKSIDADYSDVTLELRVDPNAPETEEYEVKAGDSLWKIAQQHLGNGNEYMQIFYANRDKMDSPQSVIHPGDKLKLPKK
ncbi:MAG TPA: LysM peptidoglycan-binding domain-containing protein [Pyrinomonadaceae bacterium]|jgi:LysM repeat protein